MRRIVRARPDGVFQGLHELDPAYRRVTLENPAIKAVARDLRFHHDPVGEHRQF